MAIIAATVLLGLVVVGAVVWISEPRLSTGPAVAPPAPTSNASVVDYQPRDRTASVQEMRVELPRAPYACGSEAGEAPPVFTSVRTCTALVHENYNTRGDDWYASFGMAVVSPTLVVPGDLEATGDRVYDQMMGLFFAGQQTTIEKRSTAPVEIAPTGKSVSISSEVLYSIDGLSSSYDRMLLVIVELANGEHAVCYSVRPDDAPKATLNALNGALDTLQAR